MNANTTLNTSKQADYLDIQRELAEHLASGTTSFSENIMENDASTYYDPKRWEAEKREIFLKWPMLACLSQDIAKPGDVFVFEPAGPSILVVRGLDGRVNAFLNMCTHRGTKLVHTSGHVNRISCPFHAWTYSLDGRLVGLPRRSAFAPMEAETRGLVRVPVGEWAGMIFVKAHPGNETIDVEAHLGKVGTPLGLLGLDQAYPAKSGELRAASNWKYVLDTYHEGYHVGVLHASSVGNLFHGDVIAHRSYGLNHEFSFAGKELVADTDIATMKVARIVFIFPNIVFNFYPISETLRFVSVHRIFPGSDVGSTYTLVSSYKADGALELEDRKIYEDTHDFLLNVVGAEDYELAAGAYKNLCFAPSGHKVVYGRNELALQNAQRAIASASGMTLA